MIEKSNNPEIKKEILKTIEHKVNFPELEPYIQNWDCNGL